MVEWFYRTLLSMLCATLEKEEDWDFIVPHWKEKEIGIWYCLQWCWPIGHQCIKQLTDHHSSSGRPVDIIFGSPEKLLCVPIKMCWNSNLPHQMNLPSTMYSTKWYYPGRPWRACHCDNRSTNSYSCSPEVDQSLTTNWPLWGLCIILINVWNTTHKEGTVVMN